MLAFVDDYFVDARGFALFQHVTGRNSQNWESLSWVSRESWRRRAEGNLDFIPSRSETGGASASPPEIAVRAIPPPEVRPREAYADEIPRAAKQCAKKLEDNGWITRIEYGKHSWPKQAEKIEDEDGNVVERVAFGIVESIVIKARRTKGSTTQRMFAIWMTKPWTKDGDAFKFYTAHFIPDGGKVKSTEMNKLIVKPEV
jgi:hypothetical protein